MAWLTLKLTKTGILAALLALMPASTPAVAQFSTDDFLRQYREDTKGAQGEIASLMNAVLLTLSDTFYRTRDQAMVDHHRTNDTVHAHFGDLASRSISAMPVDPVRSAMTG